MLDDSVRVNDSLHDSRKMDPKASADFALRIIVHIIFSERRSLGPQWDISHSGLKKYSRISGIAYQVE